MEKWGAQHHADEAICQRERRRSESHQWCFTTRQQQRRLIVALYAERWTIPPRYTQDTWLFFCFFTYPSKMNVMGHIFVPAWIWKIKKPFSCKHSYVIPSHDYSFLIVGEGWVDLLFFSISTRKYDRDTNTYRLFPAWWYPWCHSFWGRADSAVQQCLDCGDPFLLQWLRGT